MNEIEVSPRKKGEIMTGKYIIQYLFGAGSSAAVVPLIDSIGVGLTFTICKFLSLPLSLCVYLPLSLQFPNTQHSTQILTMIYVYV